MRRRVERSGTTMRCARRFWASSAACGGSGLWGGRSALPEGGRSWRAAADSNRAEAPTLLRGAVDQCPLSRRGGDRARLGGDACLAGIALGQEGAPDGTTICEFCELHAWHKRGKETLSIVNGYLAPQGVKISYGALDDATITSDPSSTKNEQERREREMHHMAEGKPCQFVMTARGGSTAATN